MKKYIFVILLLAVVKLCNIEFVTKDIHITGLISGFASNLYAYDDPVSTEAIEVLDYYIDEEGIWITPIKNEVALPFSGIVSEIGGEYVDIQAASSTYRIYGVKPSYFLYQYYKKGSILGVSDMYYIQTADYASVVSYLVINYEAI